MAASENPASPPKDTVAFAFLIAMILVAAVMFGVGVSGVARGTVQDLLRAAGFGASAEIRAELGRQRTGIADIGTSLGRMIGETSALGARTDGLVRSDAAQSERLTKLDDEVAMLKAKFRALLPEDPLESLAHGGTDAFTLRSTLDALAERNRHEFNALNKRLDYLENMMPAPSPDVTGTVRAPEKRRRHGRHGVQGTEAARGN